MGRSYCFDCARCGYRAKVSGRADRGLDFFVQTIVCLDCKELYDAVTRLRVPSQSKLDFQKPLNCKGLRRNFNASTHKNAPSFQAALNRLQYAGIRNFKWLPFQLQCPVSATHRVRSWTDPNKCPRCGLYLEKNALPYRIWD